MPMLLRLPDPRGTKAKDANTPVQYYTAAEGDKTLTITIPSPGMDWYMPRPIPSWNTSFYFLSQSQTGCVLRYTTPCPPGGGELLVAIIH